MGNIGEEKRTIEVLPASDPAPAQAPAEPVAPVEEPANQ